jgi:mono/diheme cytochrome c family protein
MSISLRTLLVCLGTACALSSAARAADPLDGLGKPATDAQIAAWNIEARPDGAGLPPGSGDVSKGDEAFQESCAMCHGTFGEGGGRYPKLAGEGKLIGDRPEQTVGTYWPYAVTLFDYINRAMPYPAPHSLPADSVYAITAYVLNLNGIVPDNFVADAKSLPKVKMPNEGGFTWKDPRPDTHDVDCMTNCRPASGVKIVSTAEGSLLTPPTTGEVDRKVH